MNYKRSFARVFNPVWLIGFQTIVALIFIANSKVFTWSYVAIVVIPAILGFIYIFLWRSVSQKTPSDQNDHLSSNIWMVSLLMLVVVCLINVFIIFDLIGMYGGIPQAIRNFGSIPAVTAIQRNAPNSLNLLLTFNYFLPVIIVPLVLHFRLRICLLILFVPFLLLFLVASMYGARILLFDSLMALVIARALLHPFKPKLLVAFASFGIAMLVGLASLQAARNQNNLGTGFNEIGKYYSYSLYNGAIIVAHNRVGQPLYWTLRSSFSVPLISKIIGAEAVYEGLFGKIPIKSRKDDFDYAANLGADPRYNTFSIFGYSFLDLGIWGMFIILFSYIIVYYLYRLYIGAQTLGLLLYPSMYILLFDQLRTNSIFSIRSVYFVMVSAVMIFMHASYKSYVQRFRS
jgi:oligosaccharide repeat unit polymerase